MDKHMVIYKGGYSKNRRYNFVTYGMSFNNKGYNAEYTTHLKILRKAGVMMGKKSKIVQFSDYQIYYGTFKARFMFFKDVDAPL